MIGRTLSHYKILEEISRGGMGIVYKAVDLKLNREVALKVISPELVSDSDRKRRFTQEAQAAAALKHPNIGVVYEIDQVEGIDFIAMEWIEGEKLSDVLSRGPLPLERVLDIALYVADGLRRAHEGGVLHRDLKPANIVLSKEGLPKIIDFGLAKLTSDLNEGESERWTAARSLTEPGRIMGTAAYMSPEQARGENLDARSDVFSFGVLLHEFLAASPPFRGPSAAEIMSAIIRDPHPPLPPDVGGSKRRRLQAIIDRCLAKAREERYPDMKSVGDALSALRGPAVDAVGYSVRWLWLTAGLAVIGAFVWIWLGRRNSQEVRWALETGLPEIQQLIAKDDYMSAFSLATRLQGPLAGDPRLAELWPKVAQLVSITTTPQGTNIYFRSVSAPSAEWEPLGKAPVRERRLPLGAFWLKVQKPGFDTLESMFSVTDPYESPDQPASIHVELEATGTAPSGMVRIPQKPLSFHAPRFPHRKPIDSPSYWIDALEVKNADFKRFVDSGAYRKRDLWHHEFRKGAENLEWSEVMKLFHDQTGRPGPSTWEVGSYPDGSSELPVSGVSWFEAAAYCESLGKELPTVFHWSTAAWTDMDAVLPVSNFGGSGLRPVGSGPPGAFGVHDMAGNVKEWCWNKGGDGRYILGGAWNEPDYMYFDHDVKSPFLRQANYGFRCARYTDTLDTRLLESIDPPVPRGNISPVSDEVFAAYRHLFEFDPVPLDARVVAVDESNALWRREKIAFRAAYAPEDVIAYLFLPKSSVPPFQTVVFFPGASARRQRSPEELETRIFEFLVKSGRAVMYPIYKGTHERPAEYPQEGSRSEVDYVTHLMSDLRRSVDYLATRKDVQFTKLGYYGFSWGAAEAPIALALEPRFVAAVLLYGGLYPDISRPEIRGYNYAPRVRVPVLMVNGSLDANFPVEWSQNPLFQLLGTPVDHKKHITFPTDHGNLVRFRNEMIEKILEWFDRYLGPTT